VPRLEVTHRFVRIVAEIAVGEMAVRLGRFRRF
jgi:hypothetical protein